MDWALIKLAKGDLGDMLASVTYQRDVDQRPVDDRLVDMLERIQEAIESLELVQTSARELYDFLYRNVGGEGASLQVIGEGDYGDLFAQGAAERLTALGAALGVKG